MSEQKEKISAGSFISVQGEQPSFFCSLISGTVELLVADEEYNGLDDSIVLKHSHRIALLEGKNLFQPLNKVSYRALSELIIQKNPFDSQGFAKVAAMDPAKAIALLSYLFRNCENLYKELIKSSKIKKNFDQISDNIMVLFRELSGRDISPELQAMVNPLYQIMVESGGVIPAEISIEFLLKDHSVLLKKSYTEGALEFSNFFDKGLYDFYKRFLKINSNVFAHVIKGDPHIPGFIYNNIATLTNTFVDQVFKQRQAIARIMQIIFGDSDSISSVLIDEGAINDFMASGRLAPNFLKELVPLLNKLYSMYQDLSGIDAARTYTGLSKISEFVASNSAAASATLSDSSSAASTASTSGGGQILHLYNNSLQQIFDFAVVESEFKQEFLQSLNQFKKFENPFSNESDTRKVRRHLTELYWRLYGQVYIRSKRSKSVPPPAKLMLLYGFLDEKLVEPEQIPVLHRLSSDRFKPSAPVLYEYEFLSRIYAGKEYPSISEMGVTFAKQLRDMAKGVRKGKGKDPMEYMDDPPYKVDYEIKNMLKSTTGICSGSRSTAFPIMTEKLLKGDPQNFIVTKSKLDKIFHELIGVDYSCFYRETVFKGEDSRDVIEEEVWPYIMLVPTYGTKAMMWQEIVDLNKRSRGRIVVPIHFVGDLKTELARAFARYRWELNRTLKGGLASDPVEGGITGAYSDYVQFFKKNSKLSKEAREKIANKVRASRGAIDSMFADDYILWTSFEKDGTLKLNPVVRDMFYRYVPFKTSIREKLERMPAFQDSAHRFQNIRNRTFTAFQRKFKKYQDDQDNYPPSIEKYLEFLQM